MTIMMLLITLLLPLLYILSGILFTLRTPAFRSRGLAYRSKRACLNQATWEYANHYFGVVSIFVGVYIIFATALLDAIIWKIGASPMVARVFCLIVIAVQAVLVFVIFHNTEQELKVSFDEQGRPLRREKKLRFRKRVKEEDWGTWQEWPEEEEDGWVDWETWLHNRDMELDRKREQEEAAELSEKETVHQASVPEEQK